MEDFVDEVAHLIRSQAAGIIGNLAAVTPLVLGVQRFELGIDQPLDDWRR